MLISEKVTLAMTLWVIFALIITSSAGLEVFIVLILIGVLIIRELSDVFTPFEIKNRLDVFIYVGLVIFVGILISKILNIIGIV
jgi:hypothetical protein